MQHGETTTPRTTAAATATKNTNASDLMSRVALFLPQIRAANQANENEEMGGPALDDTLQLVNDEDDEDDDENDFENEEEAFFTEVRSTCRVTGESSTVKRPTVPGDEQPRKRRSRNGHTETTTTTTTTPTIVMNLQLAPIDQNPLFDLLQNNDDNDNDNDDAGVDGNEAMDRKEDIILRAEKATWNDSKRHKGPLIAEIEDVDPVVNEPK